jgi:hypothetical protein
MTTYTCYSCKMEFEANVPATKEDETKLFNADTKGNVVVVCEDCLEWNLALNAWEKAAHISERRPN